ncbi:MAG: AMP-binding protein [Deltaproteobacteria bacterium]|nr:AMP-binding protein [Deltaproteobacteria bacterium]MBR5705135.1 AMP-binding protein [Deltaproteobacteria bacterium]
MIQRNSAINLYCKRGNIRNYEKTCEDFSIEPPEYYNFAYDVVDKWAEYDRNKLAMIWVDQQGNERKLTFRDFRNASNEAANIFLKYSIQPGTRVLIMLHRIPEWWIFMLALFKLGAIVCPVPTLLTSNDLLYRIRAGRFKMVITDEENAPKIDAVANDCPTLGVRCLVSGDRKGWFNYQKELLLPAPVSRDTVSSFERIRTRSTDPMLIYFTSGTTSEPKMALHDYSYPLGHQVTARFWQDTRSDDLHLSLTDTGWAKCAWGKIFGQWIEGACLFVYDIRGKFVPTEILPLIERYEVSVFCAPPTVYRMLVLADLKRFDLRSLRHCCSAGEPLNPETMRVWKEGTGLDIHEGYGQTETCCMIANFPGARIKPGSMGRPSPGWHIELHDEQGNPVGDNEQGRIAVRLDPRPVGLVKYYDDDDAATQKAFANNCYYTGDKAYRDEDGYYWFVGRDDDVIKSSGYRISPFEVESALLTHKDVKEAAVVGVPDAIRGIVIKAYVVLKPGIVPSEKLGVDIQNHVKKITAPYKYPRQIEFVEELPKTHSGKIRRNVLRELAAGKAPDAAPDNDNDE